MRLREAATHALIIANGVPPPAAFLRRLARDADLVVATDGGALKALRAGVRPHVVLGDMDSLSLDRREALRGVTVVPAPDQEASDLEKAVRYCGSLGATEICLTAAGGGRIDHGLVAYALMLAMAGRMDIRLREPHAEAAAVVGERTIRGAAGDTLSLIAMHPVQRVWLEGVRWPLRGEPLAAGSRGVSNVMEGESARLCVEGGKLIACHLWADDRA